MRTLLVLSLTLVAGTAAAETAESHSTEVTAIRELRLRARPGETAAVVARADRGEQLTVVDEWGRWLRVRHGGRVGWVTRTQVEARAGQARPRQRSGKAGFSGKPRQDALQVIIDADRVRGFDDPRTKATLLLELVRGDSVTVIGGGHEGWILVEHDNGVIGWIPSAAVKDGGQFAADPRGEPEVHITTEDGDGDDAVAAPLVTGATKPAAEMKLVPRPAPRRISGTVVGGAGAQTFAMRQVGGGDGMAIASGPAATVAASGGYRITGDLWLGAGADAEMGSASLTYYTAEATSAPMATKAMTMDARLAVAWGRTWQVAARAGYHYASLEVESDRAEPMLIGEQVAGMTVGVGGALPIGRKLAVSANVDVMPAGAQRPSELPTGVLYATAMQAAWARGTVAYQLPARIVAAVSYRGGVATTDLTDGAATPITAKRTDQSHALTAGIGLSW